MHRIDHATRSVDLHGAGKDGYTEGDPVAGIASTVVTDDAMNALQEEIANVIEGAGITLDKATNSQLRSAINSRFDASGALDYPAPVVRTVTVPAAAFAVGWNDLAEFSLDDAGGTLNGDPGILRTRTGTPDVNAWLVLNRLIPSVAELTRVRVAGILNDVSGLAKIALYLETFGVDFDSWVASGTKNYDAAGTLLDEESGGVARRVVLDSGVISVPMLTTQSLGGSRVLRLEMVGEDQYAYEVELTFAESGLRNT